MRGTDWIVGSRRKPQEDLGEPLFDEWWLEDQRLFQDSVDRRDASPAPGCQRKNPGRRSVRRRNLLRESGQDALFSLDEVLADRKGTDEPLRPDGAAALGEVAALPVRDDRGPGGILHRPGPPGGGTGRPAGVAAGGGRPAGRGVSGQGRRLGQARHQAEEIILAELVLLDPEPGTENQEA